MASAPLLVFVFGGQGLPGVDSPQIGNADAPRSLRHRHVGNGRASYEVSVFSSCTYRALLTTYWIEE